MTNTKSLFVLKNDTHRRLITEFIRGYHLPLDWASDAFEETAPHRGKTENWHNYTGDTRTYKKIAEKLLEAKEGWNKQCATSAYIYHPEEDRLTLAVQSRSKSDQFCGGAINKDLTIYGEGILSRRTQINPRGSKPFIGEYQYYIGGGKLLIISDCLDEIQASIWGYLIQETIDISDEVIIMTPDALFEQIEAMKKMESLPIHSEIKKEK